MFAAAIANRIDKSQYQDREDQYLQLIRRYEKDDQRRFPVMAQAVIEALEENPWQDFLGSMFMRLNLGSHWHGQFFSPYHICQFMADICDSGLKDEIQKKGWTSVCDPCCGAGVMLIAFAETCMKQEVNYQEHVIFAAQDIDMTAGLMCYIQLSLLGCPGYVIIRDTLAHPMTGHPLFVQPADDTWITPFYCSNVWEWRRAAVAMDRLCRSGQQQDQKKYFFFTFQRGAENVRSH
jgi:type I restriction-modification system DNA methylase subunit